MRFPPRRRRHPASSLLLPLAAAAAVARAFAPRPRPRVVPSSAALPKAPALRYVGHADETDWPPRREQWEEEDGTIGDHRGTTARASRRQRRESLRQRRRGGGRTTASSYGELLDWRRRELLQFEEDPDRYRDGYHDVPDAAATAATTTRSPRWPRLLSGTPMPVVDFRTNSDFPAGGLPASEWDRLARPPVPFDEAAYSECDRYEGMRVLVPRDDVSAGDFSEGAVVFDGMNYAVQIIDDVIVPAGRPDQAYWLRDKIYDAIYGRVRRGSVLRRLGSPVQVLLPPSSSFEEWAHVEYVVSDESVAVKEMGWDHIQEQRSTLVEDPIKEAAAMQHLRRFVEDEMDREEDARTLRRTTSPGDGWEEEEEEKGYDERSAMERSRIVMPTDLLSDDRTLYSIAPFCEGGRLLDAIEWKGRFSEPEARYWMRQILEGLSCLKRAGVCHRDMSPENLMVHGDGVYIIDLGMCLRIPSLDDDNGRDRRAERRRRRRRRSLIRPQSACGKWYYLSPEVCDSVRPFDGPAVDLWAASVILFTMLTGLPPWEEPKATDDNFRLMTTGHLGQMLTERRTGLSVDALDLLQRMFWLDPAHRLSLEQVWAHPWMTHGDILPSANEQTKSAVHTRQHVISDSPEKREQERRTQSRN